MGGDVKWEIHPGVVLDGTVNPDFSQVEADEERVNLTRFSLFFPEKREFFLENAGVFELGARGFFEPPPFLLFFSRRIGLDDDENEVPVVGGVRLTGRAGPQTVGFMDVYTGRERPEAPANYAVARVKRDVGGSGYVGAMVTDKRRKGFANTAVGGRRLLLAHGLPQRHGLRGPHRDHRRGGRGHRGPRRGRVRRPTRGRPRPVAAHRARDGRADGLHHPHRHQPLRGRHPGVGAARRSWGSGG